jgi:hypothetical protein
MPLGLLGGGFNSAKAAQDEFDDWYDTEHIPERLRIPGFINAVRWVGASSPRISLAVYDLESLDVLRKPEYRAVSPENFSPWSRRILQRKCERICRFNCVQMGAGDRIAPLQGTGLFVFACNATAGNEPGIDEWLGNEHLLRMAEVPGVVCARWFRTPRSAPGSSSHEFVAMWHLNSPTVCESAHWKLTWESERMDEVRSTLKDVLLLPLRRYTRSA